MLFPDFEPYRLSYANENSWNQQVYTYFVIYSELGLVDVIATSVGNVVCSVSTVWWTRQHWRASSQTKYWARGAFLELS